MSQKENKMIKVEQAPIFSISDTIDEWRLLQLDLGLKTDGSFPSDQVRNITGRV